MNLILKIIIFFFILNGCLKSENKKTSILFGNKSIVLSSGCDFKNYKDNFIEFNLFNLLTLEEIEKIKEYKVQPIK